jgi:phosphoglycolate phosphatase
MTRLAVFDCDGTLVDSQADICTAMTNCFDAEGLTAPSRAETLRTVGLSVPEAMRALLPDRDAAFHEHMGQGYKAAFHRLRAGGKIREPLYEGVRDVLDALTADGWLLGVATGKSDRGLRLCLEEQGLAGRFVTLQTADRHPSKPHPSMLWQAMADAGADPADTVMIGDTVFDIAMARAANVTAIGVAWGYHSAEELIADGADDVAADPAALLSLLATFAREAT